LLPAWAVDDVLENQPASCGYGHVVSETDRVAAGEPARRQVEELPVMAVRATAHRCHRLRCPGCGADELPTERLSS
jgi:zinc-finger binding domain of transposase IS66